MKKYQRKSMPAWAAWSVGLVMFAIVFTAGGLSLYINVAVGATMGLAAVVMFALGDVVKMVLPIVMRATGRNPLLFTTYVVVAFISFFCAFLAMSDMFGERFVAEQTAKRVEGIGATQLADLRSTLEVTRTMMLAESKNKGCGKNCQALTSRVAELETQIKAATAEQKKVTTKEMSGKAFLGQVVFGYNGKDIDVASAISVVGFQMLMMELFSLMSGFAASMLGIAIANTKRERALARAKVANAAKAAKKKMLLAEQEADRKAARAAAELEKKKKLTNHRRKVTIKQKAAEEAKIAAEKEAKKKAAVAKRKATLAKKKADAAAAAAVKPKRKWTEKQTQAYLARTLAKKQAANV